MPAFITYSFKDEAIYSAICLALDGARIDHWDSSTMSPGEPLADQLRNAILTCEVCIFLATRSSIESPWCLAEVGAFWGSRKKVIVFLADPDLTDSSLPPQFKGNLMARNAQKLIEAAGNEIEAHKIQSANNIEFLASSGKFSDGEWIKLLDDTNDSIDITGVALTAWRQTTNFKEIVIQKAKEGCRVRLIMMHLENPTLQFLAADFRMLQGNIPQNYAFFKEMTRESSNIEVRQLKSGLMYSFITRTDQQAVVLPFMVSQKWGKGPLWKSGHDSEFYGAVKTEFETLWMASRVD
jgi:hypothetical protein